MKRALLCVALVACGGASSEPRSPTEETVEPEPSTPEEAQERVQRALSQLERSPERSEPTTASTPSGATTQSDAFKAASGESVECRALHSLERATEALCKLAGAADPRCVDARAAVEKYRPQVHCP